MDFDTFNNIRCAATGVEDTMEHIVAHLSQVCVFEFFHLVKNFV